MLDSPAHSNKIQNVYKQLLQKPQSHQSIDKLKQSKQCMTMQSQNNSILLSDKKLYFEDKENKQIEKSQNCKFNQLQLLRKLEEAEEELERTMNKLFKQNVELKQKNEIIQELNQKVELLKQQNNDITIQYNSQRQENIDKTQEFQFLTDQIQYKDQKIIEYSNQIQNLQDELQIQITKVSQLSEQNNMISIDFQTVKSQLQNVAVDPESKGLMMLEIDQLKKDLVRILDLLKKTEEYQEFYKTQKDGPYHYIKKFKNKRKCICSKEETNWVPYEIIKYVSELYDTHSKIDSNNMNDILLVLNQIYLQREKNLTKKLRIEHDNAINQLQRQLTKNTGYDQICAQKKISHLKDQLKKQTNSKQLIQLNEVMQLAVEYESLLREKEQTIIELKNDKIQNNYDKKSFMQGASWILQKVTQEIQKSLQAIREIQKQYQSQIPHDSCKMIAVNLSDNIETQIQRLNSKIQTFQETADAKLISLN